MVHLVQEPRTSFLPTYVALSQVKDTHIFVENFRIPAF